MRWRAGKAKQTGKESSAERKDLHGKPPIVRGCAATGDWTKDARARKRRVKRCRCKGWLRKRPAPNLFRLQDASARNPLAVRRDARMHQVSRIVCELSGSAAGARNREKLQLVTGKSTIDDGFSVGRPVEAIVGRASIIQQLFAVRAIGADDPQSAISAFALVFERDFLSIRRPGRPRSAANFWRQRKLRRVEHLPGDWLDAEQPE